MASNADIKIRATFMDKVTASANRMSSNVTRVAKTLTSAFGSVVRTLTSLKSLITGLIFVQGARLITGQITSIAESIDKVVKTSNALGVTTKSLESLQFAAEQSGATAQVMNDTIGRLTRRMGEAKLGNEQMATSFAELGVEIESLPLGPGGRVDAVELFGQVVDGLSQIPDEARRAALAQRVLGDSYRSLSETLRLSKTELRGYQDELSRIRGPRDEAAAAVAAQFLDTTNRLAHAWKGLQETLFVTFGPKLTEALDRLQKWLSENRSALAGVAVEIVHQVAQAALEILRVIGRVLEGINRLPGFDLFPEEAAARMEEYKRLNQEAGRLMGLMSGAPSDSIKENIKQRLREVREAMVELSRESFTGQIVTDLENSLDRVMADMRAQLQPPPTPQVRPEFTREQGWVPSTEVVDLGGPSRSQIAAMERDREALEGIYEYRRQKEEEQQAMLDQFHQRELEQYENKQRMVQYTYTQMAQTIGSVMSSGVDRISGALSDMALGAKSAKEAFKEMAAGILEDIVRMTIRYTVLIAMAQLFNALTGGAMFTASAATGFGGALASGVGQGLGAAGGNFAASSIRPPPGTYTPPQQQSAPVVINNNQQVMAMDPVGTRQMLEAERDTMANIMIDAAQRRTDVRQTFGVT